MKTCAIVGIEQPGTDVIDECVVAMYQKPASIDLPECPKHGLRSVVCKYQSLFYTTPGVTDAAHHFIPTMEIQSGYHHAAYLPATERKLNTRLTSCSNKTLLRGVAAHGWHQQCLYGRNLVTSACVDYRELNKKTIKDAYPLPLPDEVQDKLAGSTIFSTLDLQSGYWQVPVSPSDQEKTTFCPGPGMGLFQFRRMPFGLTVEHLVLFNA